MTKILYLPTGEYLTFVDNNDRDFTVIIENINTIDYKYLSVEKILHTIAGLDNIVKTVNEDRKSRFTIRNKIILPAIKEHFEIIDN